MRYVGKTSQGVKRRLFEHRNDAINRERNSYSSKWLRQLFGFGLEPGVEVFEVLPDGGDWVEAEQFWIAYWRSLGCRLTNLTLGGEGLWGHKRPRDVIERGVAKRRGRKMSEEAKARMRAAWTPERKAVHGAIRRKPRKPKRTKAEINELLAQRQRAAWERNPERRKISAEIAKRNFTDTARRATGLRNRGRPATPAQLRSLSIGWSSPRKPMSAETRAKISAAAIGRVFSDKECAARSERQLGKKLSPEAREKIRQKALLRWQAKKEANAAAS